VRRADGLRRPHGALAIQRPLSDRAGAGGAREVVVRSSVAFLGGGVHVLCTEGVESIPLPAMKPLRLGGKVFVAEVRDPLSSHRELGQLSSRQ
jgi:hypothetical protein